MASTPQVQDWLGKARAWSRAEMLGFMGCALAGAGLLAWAWRLWPEWRGNPDLSHGFFALPVVVLLWRRSAADGSGSARVLGPGAGLATVAIAGPVVLATALFAAVYAVAMGWSAVPTLFLLSLAAAGAVVLAGTLAAGERVRWIRPGWAALIIPAVIALSAPLPPATYARLTLGLQEFITAGVVETLRLFGVPAMRAGNVIHLGVTSVGVEEACSGVRSLISCVLAGLVLSALMLRSPRRRAALVLAAAPLALMTNFLRSLTLTLLARGGVDIAGAWHDGLGFAVLGVTTALLAWLATVLEAGDGKELGEGDERPLAETRARSRPDGRKPTWRERTAVAGAMVCLVVAALWIGFVAVRTEAGDGGEGPAPDLARIVPERPPGEWAVETRRDLFYYFDALQTEHLIERSYQRRDPGGLTQVTVYVAWWPAGKTSVSTVAAHTPESCWPGAGWVMDGSQTARRALPLPGGREARDAEQRVFQHSGFPQRVWFWHLVAGVPFRPFDPLSWRDQLKVFFEHGVKRAEPQAFVRISTNREWEEIADEPLVAEVLKGFAELGVPVR